MTTEEKDFCISAMNDTSVEERILSEIVVGIFDKYNIGIPDRAEFVRDNLERIYDSEHLDALVAYVIEGDYEEYAVIIGVDVDSSYSVESNKDKWENSDWSDDFEELIEDEEEDDEDEY